ncbi:ribonuclease H-like domain-containing protein [Tanacetum coccineum]
MDLETAQTNTTAKLPLLKQGEYDMWKLRIEQYFQVQDYALWDVIENGNSIKPAAQTTTNADSSSTTLIPGHVTADEKTQKKNDVKARSMLLMALPNEHLLTFNQYKDAKTLFVVIQTRFGGNDATKKTQKTLLKQISLPSEWNTHVVVWRNKPDLDTMSFDDLYNNFKIVEQEVKGTASSSSSSSSQNLAFMSSTSSTNEVNTAYGVSTANTQVSTASTQVSTANLSDDTVYAFLASQPNGSQLVHEDLEQIHEDDLEEMDLKWQLALLSMRTRKFFQKTGRKITINGSDTARYDKSRNQDSSRRTINVEEISSKAMLAIDGAGFDWSFMADEEVPTNMALMAFSDSEELIKRVTSVGRNNLSFLKRIRLFSPPTLDLSYSSLEEFQQPKFKGYGPKSSKSVCEDISNEVRGSPDASLVEELVSNDKLEKKTVFPTIPKINFVRPQQQEKPVRKPVKLTAITIKGKGWPKVVNTARPNIAVVNAIRANQGHPQKENQGYVDSRCSGHMTGNMSYLSDFKEFDGGYVTFGRGAKGGRITGTGTLKIGKLDFEDNDDESGIDDQEKPKDSSLDVNTAGPNINTANINTGSLNINTVSPTVPTAQLESTYDEFFVVNHSEEPKKDSPFDLEAYTDSDYAGASLDRKSTTCGCQFLGRRLISWQCKKQTIVANSSTEAEYVATAS